MARTRDPHAAAIKAWDTRGRAQETSGGSPTQLRNDYARSGPRWTAEEPWLNKFFQKVLNKLPKPVRDLVNNFLPRITFDFNDPYQRGGYMRFPGHLRVGDASSTADVVHEIGHAVDHALNLEDRVHPGPFAQDPHKPGRPHPQAFWSEEDRDFGRAFAEDVRELKRHEERYRDWEYTASKRQEGFAAAFSHLMGFPTEYSGGEKPKPGFERSFPKTISATRRKLRQEGLLK